MATARLTCCGSGRGPLCNTLPKASTPSPRAVFDGMEVELAALVDRVEREGRVTRAAVLEALGETIDAIQQALA